MRECQERSIRELNLCLCVSNHWQHQLLEQYQIHAPRVINGVNCQRFTPVRSPQDLQVQRQLGITGSPIFLTIGSIEPRKNTLHLVAAFAQVHAVLPQAQLVIAGGATLFDYQPYRDRVFALLSQLGLEVNRTVLLPGVLADADLPSLYRCADTFVFPSVKEGWGLVVLWAIASGIPTIVSQQPPFTEFLSPRQTLFVSPHDPTAIAQAMLTSLQPVVAQALRHSRQSVARTYSWQASASMHLQRYATLSTAKTSLASLE